MLLVTGRFIQPIRFLFFHQMKMSECEPFPKGSLSIEQVQRKYELFSQLVKIANRWILTPAKMKKLSLKISPKKAKPFWSLLDTKYIVNKCRFYD